MWLVGGKREMHTGFLWINLKEKCHRKDTLRLENNIKVDLNEQAVKA
jgi:uncharacterized protein YuzE